MLTITPQQILVPKKVYIGDTAELQCTFNSGSAALKEITVNGIAELSLVSYPADKENTSYDIKSIQVAPAGVDFYRLTISFVPWETGDLQFPPLTLEEADLTLEFQPVQIVSLISTDNTNATTLRDTAAPLLLPGTAYKLYGFLAIFILVLIITIRIIVKRQSLLFYINNKRLLRKYKKNKKLAIKQLKQILAADSNSKHPKPTDQQTAERVQKIMRNYLEVRFDYPFTRAAASEMMRGWQTATKDLLSDTKEEAFGDIAASFIRTDFIRFSKDGAFNQEEKKELIEKLINRIEILEKEEMPEGENNDKL